MMNTSGITIATCNISIKIINMVEHGGTWLCFKQYKLKQYKHSTTTILFHKSVFSGLSESSKYLPIFSTVHYVLTWGR